MPRLSLYRPNKTNDYRFLDNTIKEMYTVGGLDIHIHKYLGPKTGGTPGDATQPVYDTNNPLFIEDLFLLENRDRAYDPDVYVMRGVYQVSDIDFDLTQFGLFLNNDTLFITFHYNNMIDTLGRKLMAGDVLEVPNLKDYHPLNSTISIPIPKYYVIQDAAFASEGFSQTWQPHLWRAKATPMVAGQEYNEILNKPAQPNNIWDPGNFYPAGSIVLDGTEYYRAKINVPAETNINNNAFWESYTPDNLLDTISTKFRDLEINDAILTQANVEVPLSGYDTQKFYIIPTNPDDSPGSQSQTTSDSESPTVDSLFPGSGSEILSPRANGYTLGYLTGDGIAPNGLPVIPGVAFPGNPSVGAYVLRLDYFPNRLFRYNGVRWIKVEDNIRTDINNGPDNKTQRSGFVNNENTIATADRGNIPSRQSLSDALKPEADN